MASKPLPDIDTLHQLLRYAPATGKLFWRERDDAHAWWNARYAGKEAFTYTMAEGYKQGKVNKTSLLAHRVIMAMVNGEWPPEEVDHINGVRTDNRLSNLRVASRTENARNLGRPSNNTSGHIGVSWRKDAQKWCARIGEDGQTKHLGYFPRKADAIAARKAAESEHGFHKNHGR